MPKWIDFIPTAQDPKKKTKLWFVDIKGTTNCLGRIKWFSRWRKYGFFPIENTVYEEQCLRDISEFIERATKEHKQKNKKSKLTRNTKGKENSAYWKKAEETAKTVESWPSWKRNIQIGKIGAENNPDIRVT